MPLCIWATGQDVEMVEEQDSHEESYLDKLKDRRRDLEALILMLESSRSVDRAQAQIAQRKGELNLLCRQIGILEMVEER